MSVLGPLPPSDVRARDQLPVDDGDEEERPTGVELSDQLRLLVFRGAELFGHNVDLLRADPIDVLDERSGVRGFGASNERRSAIPQGHVVGVEHGES